jgi:hypothetical protein
LGYYKYGVTGQRERAIHLSYDQTAAISCAQFTWGLSGVAISPETDTSEAIDSRIIRDNELAEDKEHPDATYD